MATGEAAAVKTISVKRTVTLVILALAGLTVTVVGCGDQSTLSPTQSGPEGGGTVAPPSAKLVDLTDLNDLRTLFNRDAGFTRVVLIISPT